MYVNGKVYSELQQTCLEVTALNNKLNALKDGSMAKGSPAYILFNNDKTKAELFIPQMDKGMVLDKTNEGNWSKGDYKLIAWKGYVVQYKGKAIFGGE